MSAALRTGGLAALRLHLPNVADVPLNQSVHWLECSGQVQGRVNQVDGIPGDGAILRQTTCGPDAQNIKNEQKKKARQPRERMLWLGIRVFPWFCRRFGLWSAHPMWARYGFVAGTSI